VKILYSWIKDYVGLDVPPHQLGRDLTDVGFPLEKIEETAGDALLEIDVTSNRGDCLCHVGLAREAAAIYGKTLQMPDCRRLEADPAEIDWNIRIRDKDLCRRYCALILTGIRVAPSPSWLQDRLKALGQRPINNIVDITNYVLLELGHPLHAFDLDRLEGKSIIVRRALPGEMVTTLDQVRRTLNESMLVIADQRKAVALAGVMGGEESEISPGTSRVLLESAHFHPGSIRRTAKTLGMNTEASYRFERTADIENAELALGRCARLILEWAGGKVASRWMDAYPGKKPAHRILLDPARVRALSGAEIPDAFISERLSALAFGVQVKSRSRWQVTVPSHRNDVARPADLVEEAARHYNYARIPATLGTWNQIGHFPPWKKTERNLRESLRGMGFSEVINTNFSNVMEWKQFPGYEGSPISLENPLSEEDGNLRWNILPLALRNCRTNFHQGQKDLRLFELAKTFYRSADGEPQERKRLALLATGQGDSSWWAEKAKPISFHHFKGLAQGLLRILRWNDVQLTVGEAPCYLDPIDFLAVWHQDKIVGGIGKLAKNLEESYKFKQPVFLADLDLESLFAIPIPATRYQPLPRYPGVIHDLSMVFDPLVRYNDIQRVVRDAGVADLQRVEIFDRYVLQNDPGGRISITLRLWYQNEARTLTLEEVNEHEGRIVDRLKERLGGELRK
jgi:phenylalanyl-tRNA synthetase beta chain